ncbi:MAG TPA: sigma-70 family RNA polymerase sigma factor [Gaiellaceae bacterium]|nr:sigma-70 family RNA polymerase sigma factor [Gaiellaceae bacterium]
MSPTSAAAGQALDAARLYELYGEQLYRYCLGRLRDREEAADAVQNTFLRVHVALEKGVVPQFESAWLYKIAHNVCLNRIESNGRRARLETPRDLDDHDLECALAVPENENEALAGLADALADLPHNLRQAILLREWQGLSYAEIAAAMDTTVPAVETLLYRARRQLAEALERGGRRTRRTLAGLLDLLGIRALLERLGTMLSGAGAAKVAAGAALLAVGGSGVGAAIALENGTARHRSPAPALERTADLVAHTGAVSQPAASPSGPAGFRERATIEPAPAAAGGGAAGEPDRPLQTPSAPAAPAGTPATSAGGGSAGTSATTTPGGSGPLPALPATGATPTVAVPTVQTPTLQTPTVQAPTVDAPTLAPPTLPTATTKTPTLGTPTLQTPTVQTPTAPDASGVTSGVTSAVTTPTVPSLP